jgi:solute carrier family 25 citrate transporter 1
MLRQTLAQRGLKGLYAGCSAVVVGNAVKAGVRFTTYDQFKQMLSDDEVRFPLRSSLDSC